MDLGASSSLDHPVTENSASNTKMVAEIRLKRGTVRTGEVIELNRLVYFIGVYINVIHQPFKDPLSDR